MEDTKMSNGSSSSALLAQAFGRRLRDGDDEWRGVADVVRSSFLLLYGELRRQNKQRQQPHIAIDQRARLPADTSLALALVHEQLALVREELRLAQAELQQLREQQSQPCAGCCASSYATRQSTEMVLLLRKYARVYASRHKQLRRRVAKLQFRLTRTQRAQHECEEIVVGAAEHHTRRLQKLQANVETLGVAHDTLRQEVVGVVKPRLRVLETHVVATQRAVKRLYKQQQQQLEQHKPRDDREVENDRDVMALAVKHCDKACETDKTLRGATMATELPTPECSSTGGVTYEKALHLAHQLDLVPNANRVPRLQRDGNDENDDDDDDDKRHPIEDEDKTPPASPTRTTHSIAHASLRLRYHRERTRQLRRLDRLRLVPPGTSP